ncbi:MAG: rod shape-determining protein MreD [Firmicutes bacterium]|jgi:rod shape-determining protein MreD|nr:rod shape-determining protein MreD [Bacillota bacterium]MDH7494977.1 rod shape-determining protein MreD [Bacillota bacterium]
MRNLLLLLAGAVLVLLEMTVVPHIALQGVKPDLVLILVVLVGTYSGWRNAALAGLATGFIEDACSGQFLGLFMLTRTVVGIGAGLSYARVFEDRVIVPTVLVILGGVVGGVLHCFLLSSFGVPMAVSVSAFRMIVGQALYSGLLVPITLRVVARLDARAKRVLERRQAA